MAFNGVYTNFNSVLPETFETGLINSQFFHASVCALVKSLEVDILQSVAYLKKWLITWLQWKKSFFQQSANARSCCKYSA